MGKYNMKKSYQLFEKAKKLVPGGMQNTRRPSCFTEAYPKFANKANGSHLWDVDGNEYIDWMLAFGPIILGYCNNKIDAAVKDVIKNGFIFSLAAPTQLTLAEKLIEHIPSAEMYVSVMNGSDATAAAVRIAKVYTGREVIIRWGYHGWLDWCVDNHIGVSQGVTDSVKTFKYNDLTSLEEVLEKNKNKVACIIMMPFEVILPEKGFLEGVRELANSHKVVLIFDEIRSWPRMGLGGAQKYFGVTPDITTLSKGLGNGYPISAVVGKAEVMEVAEKTVISATYFPNILGVVAALETIRQLEDGKVIDHIWKVGLKLKEGLRELIKSRNVEATIFGAPPMPFLMFGNKETNINALNIQPLGSAINAAFNKGDKENERIHRLTDLFYSETIKRGIFFHPKHNWFTCWAHTEEDIKKTLKVSDEALDIAIKRL